VRHPHGRAAWAVLCDFDGTITIDVTDSLLLRFGRPGWEALEDDWRAGRIGSRQCMAGQVALLDCSREELDDHLARAEVDPGFAGFVAAVGRSGAQLCIVSDGLDQAIDAVLRRHGIEGIPVYASRLVQSSPRSWRLEFPHARSGCDSATCKCSLALPPHAPPGCPVLVVGDGDSDACVAAKADMVFARKRLLGHCEAAGLRHRRTNDFAAALVEWHALAAPSRADTTEGTEETLDA
jgi:2-hydroxy-3-keto-5-methylthiopentenyl-1-phosphate phosphatase